jgi:hypothetical protein
LRISVSRSDPTLSPSSSAIPSAASSSTSKDGEHDNARGVVVLKEGIGGGKGGEGGHMCPRVDFGQYLLSCAQKYGGAPGGLGNEDEEEEEEERRQDMVDQVRACLLTDWDLGFSWFH